MRVLAEPAVILTRDAAMRTACGSSNASQRSVCTSAGPQLQRYANPRRAPLLASVLLAASSSILDEAPWRWFGPSQT